MNAKKLNEPNENNRNPSIALVQNDEPKNKSVWKKIKNVFQKSEFSYRDWQRLEEKRVRPQDHKQWRNF
ncbi:MAG TPA: hypothetical protein VIG33_07215 [Pseudobdellovibrionaceae bacterium]